MSRPLVRSLLGLGLAMIGAAAWFGLPAVPSAPAGPILIAAPSASPSATPSAVPAMTPNATPSAKPSPTPSHAPAPTPRPSAIPSPPAATSPRPSSTVAHLPAGAGYGIPSADRLRATPAIQAALTVRLDDLRATYGLPGVSAAILFADGSSWLHASGLADVAGERPVTEETAFAVASISKTFLAALILTLVEDGKLGLEASVRTYLPSLPIDDAITVRQLLDHTSGLHDFFDALDIDDALLVDRVRVWTAQDALGYVGKPYFEPGRGWHYSNTNYLILGLLAEEIGGEPLADQLRARFFVPLGLDRTYYQGVENPRGPLALAYRFSGPGPDLAPIPLTDGTGVVPFTSVVTAAGSAGSIASTAEDLVVWARKLYGGRVLTVASQSAMLDDVATTAPFKPSMPYGLGVQAPTIDGRPTLGHSGRLLGSRAVVRWLSSEGIAVAVLTNQSRIDPNVLVRDLLRVVLGPKPD
jgi:D-alanyl-D-alanine carboxypeptidase